MFYHFEYALRIELGGERFGADRPIRRFLQAHERANVISQSLFENSSEIFLLLSTYGRKNPDRKRLTPLRLCGMKRNEFKYVGGTPQRDQDHIAEFGADLYRHWDIAEVKDKQSISDILWMGIASELAITPSFRGTLAYLVDVSSGLVLHVYDDRGMDVAAMANEPLKGLFRTYRDWMLEHDSPSNDRYVRRRHLGM